VDTEYVNIGEIKIRDNLSEAKLVQLDVALKETGLELIFDRSNLLVQKIKNIIFELIHNTSEPLTIKFSCYLNNRLNYNYGYLANIFSKACGMSIERYIILQKIEKVKSLLIEESVYLSEIAFMMNYSSVGHLSAQFKKVTGIRVRDFKKMYQNAYSFMYNRVAV
jgi:YesN/AraC family two-component response regulator